MAQDYSIPPSAATIQLSQPVMDQTTFADAGGSMCRSQPKSKPYVDRSDPTTTRDINWTGIQLAADSDSLALSLDELESLLDLEPTLLDTGSSLDNNVDIPCRGHDLLPVPMTDTPEPFSQSSPQPQASTEIPRHNCTLSDDECSTAKAIPEPAVPLSKRRPPKKRIPKQRGRKTGRRVRVRPRACELDPDQLARQRKLAREAATRRRARWVEQEQQLQARLQASRDHNRSLETEEQRLLKQRSILRRAVFDRFADSKAVTKHDLLAA
eukprot:m.63195 g.63195  ORF g.63195 m.63195 type:complete len:268 (+) comp13959_c0_seq2:157-960(+)